MVEQSWAKLKKGSVASLSVKVGSLGTGFLLSIILARNLGVNELGTYSFIMSWVGLVAVLTKMGFPELLLREVARFDGEKKSGLLAGILQFSDRLILAVSLIVFVILALAIYGGRWLGFDLPLLTTFSIGAVLVPILSLGSLRQASLRALNEIARGLYPENLVKPVLMSLAIILFAVSGLGGVTAGNALWLNVLASLITLILVHTHLRNALPNHAKVAVPKYDTAIWLRSASSFLVIGGLLVINSQADRIMLGSMGHLTDVGVYTVAVQISGFAGYPLVAMLAAIAPIVVRLGRNGEMHELQSLISRGMKIVIGVTLAIAALLLIGSDWLLAIFGEGFTVGKTAMCILLVGQLVNSVAGPSGMVLNMLGNEKFVLMSVLVSTIANVTLNYFLIPLHGMSGAAFATAFSLIFWNGLLVFFVWKFHRIKTTPLLWFRAA